MPDRFIQELLAIPTVRIRKWTYRAVPFFKLVPESRRPPLRDPPNWLYTSGRPNRFNTRGLHCLYLSEEEATAVAEERRALVGEDDPPKQNPVRPVVFRIEVRLRQVLDLTDASVCTALGLDRGDLERPWRCVRIPSLTQILGAAVAAHSGISAIRFPSIAAKEKGLTGVNIVIFRDQISAPDKVVIYGEDGKPAQTWPVVPKRLSKK